MSGRALHPISINVAARLQEEFEGTLDISFSAGTDCFSIADVLACNLKPVTVCSDILKPGGYTRLSQYLED
jgi:putative selenate reductase